MEQVLGYDTGPYRIERAANLKKASNMFGTDERASKVIESYPKASNVTEFRI